MIRLSIVIATYNRATLLLDALKSVIRQSAPAQEWECVVVNNNSSDNTSECFAEFASGHPEYNLRIVNEPNQGLSYARNRGIRESVGEYIAIIDDDEHIAEDFVAAYIKLFDSVPEAVAAGGPIVAEYPTGRPRWMSCYTERPIANTMYFGEEVREFPKGRVPGGGNMALRRSAIRRYGVFDTSLGYSGESLIGGEECDLFERLQIADAKYYYVPTAVMYHIIPREKLTKEYFARLSYNVGVSQLRRARLYRRVWRVRFVELSKWVATLLIALWYTITLQWRKGYYLILMRLNISRGLWSRSK
ncbi:MAG: glycosyltransferase [Alistipes sp.]|nr:glycosyltransferase [Alistipes sp.]MBR7097121.1 glycosyltransferase [Alistipes sp.]